MPSLLPPNPSLRHLKLQVDDLLRGSAAGEARARARRGAWRPETSRSAAGPGASGRLTRARAQLVVARRYGFASWPKLKHYVEAEAERQEVEVLFDESAGDLERVRQTLRRRSDANRGDDGMGHDAPLLCGPMGQTRGRGVLLDRGADPNVRHGARPC